MTEFKTKKRRYANNTSLTIAVPKRGDGFVRILAGQWRKSLVPVALLDGLRPTGERVRETVFDWLYHLFSGEFTHVAVLDLFAGSGAMGLEAASRGANLVHWVDNNRLVVRTLRQVLERLKADSTKCAAYQEDAHDFISRNQAQYDVIFIDPPFAKDWQKTIVSKVIGLMKSEGVLYVESPERGLDDEVIEALGLVRIRQGKAGAVVYELYARQGSVMSTKAKLPKVKKGKQ